MEEYAAILSRQIEWVGKLVLLTATPLLLTEGRQTVTRYKAMMRANNQPVLPTFPPRQRRSHHYDYSDMQSDEDLVGNAPSIMSSRASSARGAPTERGRATARGGRKGRSSAPSRGPPHHMDLDETPQDSSVSPAWRRGAPTPSNSGPSHANGKKDK